MHIPVLQKEVLEYLDPEPNENFIDCTVHEGGHSLAILEKTKPKGKVLGIDLDKSVVEKLKLKIKDTEFAGRLVVAHGNYADLKNIAEKNGFNKVSGVLFDLGMSSWHIDESERGFTLKKEEGLDMRYDTATGMSAAEIINTFSYSQLEKIFREYGEEKFAGRIAEKIIETRKRKPIKTTADLVEIVGGRVGGKIHPATRAFQALRIAVNDELGNLSRALPEAIDILSSGDRIAVISFHSLEDRIVKNFFQEQSRQGKLKILTKKPVISGFAEIKANPRARSAKLRVAELIP